MPIRTKRWNDPFEDDDGHRLLITRYRPRGVSKAQETWHEWRPELGPSPELLSLFKGKVGEGIPWATYRRRYLSEMRRQTELIDQLAQRAAGGETITLLCSSSCTREARCHRSILRELIERRQELP